MKALRILGLVVGGMVIVTAVVVGLALLPAVQTWAVRKAVAGQPGLTLEVGRVAAGLSSAEIESLRVVKDGAVIEAKRVQARYSIWNYLTGNKIDVELAAVDGLAVDLRQMKTPPQAGSEKAPAAAPTARQAAPAFAGVLQLAQLPFDLRVAKIVLKGTVTLPDGQTVALDVQGGEIETGKRGKIDWRIAFADARKAAAVSAVQATGSVVLHIAADRRIDEIVLENRATLQGPGLPADAVVFALKAAQAAPGADEDYAAQVALVRQQKEEPLLKAKVRYEATARLLSGSWEAGVRSEQLAALLAGLGLPETALEGAGKFTLKPDTGAVTAEGSVDARLAKLEKLSPALEAVGAMQVRTAYAVAFSDDVASLKRLEVEASSAQGKKLLQVATRQNVSFNLRDKRVTLADPSAELAQISVQGLPLAWAQPVLKPIEIRGGDLSLRLSASAEADGSRVRVRTVEPVSVRGVTLRDGGRTLVEGLSLQVSPQIDYNGTAAEVTAALEALELSLAAGDSVKGRATAKVTALQTAKQVVTFGVQLRERVVSVLKPYLPVDLGPLDVDTSLDGRLEGRTLQLGSFGLTVKREGGVALVAAQGLQPISLNLDSVRVSTADGSKPALRVRLGEAPLAWAEAFVPQSKFEGGLKGGTVEVLLRSLEDLELRMPEPIAVRGIGVKIEGRELARALDLLVDLSAARKGESATFELRKLTLQQGDATLLRFDAAGSARLGAKITANAKGNLDADLTALARQPSLASLATLSRGLVAATFDVSMADALKAALQVKARQLTVAQGNRTLGDVDLSLDGSFKADGSAGEARIPLAVILPNRKSDLLVVASLGKAASGPTFQAKVTSSQLFVDDLQAFAALAPQEGTAAKPAAGAPAPAGSAASNSSSAPRRAASGAAERPGAPARGADGTTGTAAAGAADRDTVPFWKSATGGVEIALENIQYGAAYRIQGVRCTAKISDTLLALEKFEGRFNDNPFSVAASVAFAGSEAQPYTLAGKVRVEQFDVGAFLAKANPNEKPQLETKVSVLIDLGGKGGTALDLGKNAYGRFDVTGTPGVLRALGKRGETVSKVAAVVGLVGALRGSDTTMATAELASELNEMRFERFTMRAERGADLTIKLTSLEFISPTIKLTGNGSLANKAGVPIDQQPLQVVLQLAGKDHMAMLLNKAKLLSGEKDAQGYYLMTRTFELGGTPSKPDSSQLWKIIGEAGLKAGAGLLFR